MCVFDALALFAYWRRHPPTHEILKAVYGGPPPPPALPEDPSNIAELLARHPSGTVRAG